MKKRPGVVAGYAMKQLFRKPATIKYPQGGLVIDRNYRGKLSYNPANCIGCNLCVRDCPADALEIINAGTKENKAFECHLNLAHCIFCGQCVDSCKKGCLVLTPNIELAGLKKADFKMKL